MDVRFKRLIRMGAIAIIWSLWLCRNDKIFNNTSSSFLQVIYRCTAILRSWVPLQRVEHRDLFTKVSSRLEDAARDIISNMDGSVTFGLIHLASFLYSLNFIVFFEHQCGFITDICAVVCILTMQRPGSLR